MLVKDLINFLAKEIPFDLAETWDNVGFQCGREQAPVNKIVLALDPTKAAIDFAIKHQAQLLVTHHPLIFSPLKKVVLSDPVGELLIKLIKHDLNLLVLHTNLDSIKDGVSAALLKRLGIEGQGIIKEGKRPDTGFGYWGFLERPLEKDEFIDLVYQKIRPSCIRATGRTSKIHKIGVCGGSGAELIPYCLQQNIDALVLGEIKYHAARNYEYAPILIVEVGHYESEKFVLTVLKEKIGKFIQQRQEEVEIFIFEEKSPYKYYK